MNGVSRGISHDFSIQRVNKGVQVSCLDFRGEKKEKEVSVMHPYITNSLLDLWVVLLNRINPLRE